MTPRHEDRLEYEAPRQLEELEAEPGAVLSLVALVAMIALPAALVVFLLFVT